MGCRHSTCRKKTIIAYNTPKGINGDRASVTGPLCRVREKKKCNENFELPYCEYLHCASTNPHLKIKNEHEALNLSLMPGISGTAYKGAKRDPHDVWANSGYGLYMTSRLSREGGSFFIASGDTGLYLYKTSKKNRSSRFP